MPSPSAYLQSLRTALVARRQVPAPSLARVTWPFAVALLGVVLLAYVLSPADDVDFHFREEDGIVTTLSAISLSMASAFAGVAFLFERKPGFGLRAWWLLTCLAFFFFACDELLRFHEQMGTLLRQDVLGRPQHFFRNWNDVIVILYGVVALPFALHFAPRVLGIPLHAELLVIGFLAYAFHTAVDVLPHGDGVIGRFMASIPSSIPEESGKLFASAFFANAMLQGLRIVGGPARTEGAAGTPPSADRAPTGAAPAEGRSS
jgi:hypothetical protein